MVVLAGHKPVVAIECGQQILRRPADLDAVPWPNLNCLSMVQSLQGKRQKRLRMKDVLQKRSHRLRPGLNPLDRELPFHV